MYKNLQVQHSIYEILENDIEKEENPDQFLRLKSNIKPASISLLFFGYIVLFALLLILVANRIPNI
jgi:hypothetical protein